MKPKGGIVMEKARALQVLSVLAQGVDPMTGQVLPDNGPYNTPETLRALHIAMDSLLRFVSEGWRSNEGVHVNTSVAILPEDSESLRRRAQQAWSEDFPEMDEAQRMLFDRLKHWRNEQAKEENVPGYLVFSNATLARVAHDYPDTLESLAKIKGIGEVKMSRYSDMLLDIVTSFVEEREMGIISRALR
jgi:superfamily II DNA helicase RecQ